MRVPSSAMQMSISREDGKKHYSFLNLLDDIAVPSADLDLAPRSTLQVDKEASIRRLSAALHTLAGGQNSKQLPALPIPSYDNGLLDLERTCLPGADQAIHVQRGAKRDNLKHTKGFKHVPRINLGESFSTKPFAAHMSPSMNQSFSQNLSPRPVTSNASHKRTSSEADTPRAEKRLSKRLSRPTSMYGLARRQTVTTGQRPTTSAATTDPAGDRKRSIAYSDQRCTAPSLDREPSRPSTATQSPRRRFKIPASFKDLHFKSERRKRLQQNNSPPPPLPVMRHIPDPAIGDILQSTQMTIQQAIACPPAMRDMQSPLHDEFESQKFTRECIEGLALKSDPPKTINMSPEPAATVSELSPQANSVFGPRLAVQSSTFSSQSARPTGDKNRRSVQHAHRFSEVESISSSILDYDWPQPEAYRTVADHRQAGQDHGRPRPDSGIGGSLNVMNVLGKQGPFYPPPTSALPPTPGQASQSLQPQKYHLAVTKRRAHSPDALSTVLLPPVTFSNAKDVQSKSRLTALAETQGLHMNLTKTNSIDSTSSDSEDTGPVLISPLRLRSQRSNRSVRIDSLRRKHLSIHGKDDLSRTGCGECYLDSSTWVRRDSAPDTMQSVDSYHRLSRQSFHRRCTSNDKNKRTSPCLSPSGNHTRQTIRTSITNKVNASRVQKAQKLSPRSQRIGVSYEEVIAAESKHVAVGNEPNFAPSIDPRSSKEAVVSNQKLFRLSTRVADFRRHSRQCSVESQPSTLCSSASTAMSTDTEITLPSPCEEETLRLNKYASQPYSKGNVRIPSPLVSHFETSEDKKIVDTQTDLTPRSHQMGASKASERFASQQNECMDGVGRCQRKAPLVASRDNMKPELDPQQWRTPKKRQARTQLAHDLQFELDQLEQMKRVYRAMHSARDRDRARGHRERSYAQCLDDERTASVTEVKPWRSSNTSGPSSRRTSQIIAKIEADLRNSPSQYHRVPLNETSGNCTRETGVVKNGESQPGDEAAPSPVEFQSVSPPRTAQTVRKPKHGGLSLFPIDRTPPKPRNIPSPASFASSNNASSYRSTLLKKPKSPSSTISSLDSKRSKKRYSFVSIYNNTTPQYSPTSSIFSDYRTPTSRSYSRQQQLTPPPEGRELQLAATIMPTKVNRDLNVDAVVNSSSRIDQAIDIFTMGKP